jgi:hypothetical protein
MTTSNAHLHLPHASNLPPDLEHFYYQQQQRQQLVDMGMGLGMAAGMAGMGAPRVPLPRQDLSLRPQRSTSSIAQARHQANHRHHNNTSSPTNNSTNNNNWELGMEAYRQQQVELAMEEQERAARRRRSSEEAEYIQRLSASYNNNSQAAQVMHMQHLRHPTLQHPPLHYYHPQRQHHPGISHPHSDLSSNNNHNPHITLNTHHILPRSHSNNSLITPHHHPTSNSSSTSTSISNSPIHPHFPTHPLLPQGGIHLTAHDRRSQMHPPSYAMHEETEDFGPHPTTSNSNSSSSSNLEAAAGMVMGADNMPVCNSSTAKFASPSLLTPPLHLG